MSKWKPRPGAALSAREREIIEMRGEGLTLKEIAERLFIEPRTVAFHCQSVYTKLGVHGLLQALRVLNDQKNKGDTS